MKKIKTEYRKKYGRRLRKHDRVIICSSVSDAYEHYNKAINIVGTDNCSMHIVRDCGWYDICVYTTNLEFENVLKEVGKYHEPISS